MGPLFLGPNQLKNLLLGKELHFRSGKAIKPFRARRQPDWAGPVAAGKRLLESLATLKQQSEVIGLDLDKLSISAPGFFRAHFSSDRPEIVQVDLGAYRPFKPGALRASIYNEIDLSRLNPAFTLGKTRKLLFEAFQGGLLQLGAIGKSLSVRLKRSRSGLLGFALLHITPPTLAPQNNPARVIASSNKIGQGVLFPAFFFKPVKGHLYLVCVKIKPVQLIAVCGPLCATRSLIAASITSWLIDILLRAQSRLAATLFFSRHLERAGDLLQKKPLAVRTHDGSLGNKINVRPLEGGASGQNALKSPAARFAGVRPRNIHPLKLVSIEKIGPRVAGDAGSNPAALPGRKGSAR